MTQVTQRTEGTDDRTFPQPAPAGRQRAFGKPGLPRLGPEPGDPEGEPTPGRLRSPRGRRAGPGRGGSGWVASARLARVSSGLAGRP
ncbi:hypothetical protein ABIA38_002805 [Embleya sp. AB8]